MLIRFLTKKLNQKSFKGIFMLVLMLFFIQIAWAQNDEQSSDSKAQSSYPDLQPAGFVQSYFSASDMAADPVNFSIARARMGVKGNINENIKLSFIGGAVEPPNNSPALVNAFADFTIHPLFNLRAGQFLIPFGLEGPEPIIKNPAINRARPTKELNTLRMFRDIGVMTYGKYEFISYSIAVINGNGANVTENRYQKDVLGRLDFSLTDDLMAGVSGHLGTFESDPYKKLSRQRWGAHAEYKSNPFHFRGEIMLHDRELNPDTRNQDIGGYLLGKYKIDEKWAAIGRWDYYAPDNVNDIYQGVTLGTNYQLNGLSSLSLNGVAYSAYNTNTVNYMLRIQLQLVL